MSRRFRFYLEDIQASCEKVLRYTQGMNFEDFQTDERTFDAVVWNLQIIGEAAKNVSQEVHDLTPQIEWRKIAGLQDILVHAYFQIDDETIWDVVQNKVPVLNEEIQRMLETELGGT